MSRIVIRPRIQVSIVIVAATVWTLIGVTYFTSGDVVAKRQWFGVVMGCLLIMTGPAGIWRALRLGVVISAEGIRVRSFGGRDRVTPWSAVGSIECSQIGARAGLPLYAPVLRLAHDAGVMPLVALGSYSRRDAERKVRLLESVEEGVAGATRSR